MINTNTKDSQMKNTYYVYWYHLLEDKDIFCQGYIGVTKSLKKRHIDHMCAARNNTTKMYFHEMVRKYGEDSIDVARSERGKLNVKRIIEEVVPE